MSENKKSFGVRNLPTSIKLFASAIFLMGATICTLLEKTWATRPDYSFGYLVPIFALYILWIRKDDIIGYFAPRQDSDGISVSESRPQGLLTAFLNVFFGSMFLGGISIFVLSGFLFFLTQNRGAPSFVMTFAYSTIFFSSTYIISGTDAAGNKKSIGERLHFMSLFVFPSFVWLIAAPLFGVLEELISLYLLSIVANIDYAIMDALGFVVTLRGNVLEFPNGSVGVAEACSGIRSLTACIFAGSFLAAAMLDKFWKQIALVVSSMFLAFFFNLLRALFLALWAYENGADSISGTVHDTAGYIILGCTVVGLLLLVQLFNLNPIPKEFRNEAMSPKESDAKEDINQ